MQIVAAGIAFYLFLSIFPAIVAIISIYGLVVSPGQAESHINSMSAALPQQAHDAIRGFASGIASKGSQALGWGTALSLFVSLWSANKATKAIFEGVGIAYSENDERGFFKKIGLTLLTTFCGILVGILLLVLVAVWPAMVGWLPLPSMLESAVSWARWPVMAIIVMFSLAAIYRVAPDRRKAQWKWLSAGSVIATILWIIGSVLFSWYVDNFGSYNETYGSFAVVIILMLWFFITAFSVLLGAEINAETELQTARDSTHEEPRPMGERDAYHADHQAAQHDEGDQAFAKNPS